MPTYIVFFFQINPPWRFFINNIYFKSSHILKSISETIIIIIIIVNNNNFVFIAIVLLLGVWRPESSESRFQLNFIVNLRVQQASLVDILKMKDN